MTNMMLSALTRFKGLGYYFLWRSHRQPEILQEAFATLEALATKDFPPKERLEEPQEGYVQGSRLAQKNNQHPCQLGSAMYYFLNEEAGSEDARNRVIEAEEYEP